ncbi:MAG TPA: hypothetical protein VF817_00210 [Patescibacteria group bacterium]
MDVKLRELKGHAEVDSIMEALVQFANDRDTLIQMRRTTELRRDALQERLKAIVHSRHKHKKPLRNMNNRFKMLRILSTIIKLLSQAIEAHKSILRAARGKRRRKSLEGIFDFFKINIQKIQERWPVLEDWFIDARRILGNILLNAKQLQNLSLAPSH